MTAVPTDRTASAQRGTRPSPGVLKQTLRLTRTEFVLFYRYRMALYTALLPVMFVLPAFLMPAQETAPGVESGPYFMAGVFALAAMTMGVFHVPNVYAARREGMILKRFRVSGVAPAVLFGSTTLSVLGVVLVQSVLITGVLVVHFDAVPTDAVLLLLSIMLITVVMCLLGLAFTRFARNAESAQMISMIPFLGFLAVSGFFVPVDLMPDRVADLLFFLPMLPAVGIARSAYFGQDLFRGAEQATAATGLDLWALALPSLLVLIAWVAIAAYLVRFFRWDPRQAA